MSVSLAAPSSELTAASEWLLPLPCTPTMTAQKGSCVFSHTLDGGGGVSPGAPTTRPKSPALGHEFSATLPPTMSAQPFPSAVMGGPGAGPSSSPKK